MDLGPEFSVTRRRAGDAVVVVPEGEIDLATIDELQAELDAAAGRAERVVLDLRAVTFIDSAGVRLVLEAMRALPRVRGRAAAAPRCRGCSGSSGSTSASRIVDRAAGRVMTPRRRGRAGGGRGGRAARRSGGGAPTGERFALIRGAALIADSGGTIPEVIERVRALLVPAFADACEIHLGDGEQRPRRDAGRPAALARADDRHDGAQSGSYGEATTSSRCCSAAGSRSRWRTPARVARGLARPPRSARWPRRSRSRTSAARWCTPTTRRPPALGFESAEQLLATPPREIVDAYESFNEDGSPLRMEQLPGRRLLAGETPGAARRARRRPAHRRGALADRQGDRVPGRRLAVNVIEDVTEVKRAEMAQRFLAEAGAVLASSLDYEQTLARIAELAVPRLADWCSVSLPDGDRLRTVAVAHADPDKVRFARDYQAALSDAAERADGRARRCCATASRSSSTASPTSVLDAAVADPEQREAVRGLGMRAVHAGADGGGRARDRRDQPRQRRVRAHVRAQRPRAGRGARPARRHRGRERPPVPRALAHRRDAPARAAAGRAARRSRGCGSRRCTGRRARRTSSAATSTTRSRPPPAGCCWSATSPAAARTPPRRPGRRGTRCARPGMLLGDPARRARAAQPRAAERRELTPCTVAIVHVTGRTAHVLCAGHPQPLLIRDGRARAVGHFGPMLGAWPDSTWRADPVELVDGRRARALHRRRDRHARRRRALRRRAAARGAARRRRAPPGRCPRSTARSRNSNVVAQADDTAILALDLPPVGA